MADVGDWAARLVQLVDRVCRDPRARPALLDRKDRKGQQAQLDLRDRPDQQAQLDLPDHLVVLPVRRDR